MASVAHSHRPTTKVTHKPFKSKAATKHELRDRAKGKVPNEGSPRKTPHQQVMSKFDRRNQAKQARLTKHKEHQRENSIFNGKDGAPRVVAVVPLCSDGDSRAAVQHLNNSLDIETGAEVGSYRVSVDRFKQKLQYIPLERDLSACLDAARVADFVVVLLSADVEVDALGELILRGIESQGMSTLFTMVQGLEKVEPAKQKQSVLGSLRSFITHFHPEQDKLYSVENRQECLNLLRSLCSATPKGIRWREDRSWMLAEDVNFAQSEADSTIITGVVRGRGLKADRLVQIGDWGAFQIDKIVSAPFSKRGKGNATGSDDAEEVLDQPTEDADDLHELAPGDVLMEDEDEQNHEEIGPSKKGVLLDDHHYFSDEDEFAGNVVKRVPEGTSKYQAAWYLDDFSDSGSDLEDIDMDDDEDDDDEAVGAPEDGEGFAGPEPTEAGPSEYPQSEMMEELDDEAEAEQLLQYRARKRDEVEDDKEFPDEIELLPNVLARERLSRYRGLKSLRTSPWEESEDRAFEPEEWRQLLQVPEYQGAKSRAIREALVGGVAPGTRVHVYVKGIPPHQQRTYNPQYPITLFSLLRHEHKKTVANYLFNLSADCTKSVKAKEEIIAQCGPRRMVIKPVFSQPGSTPNDVHKYCRWVHPGQSAVATFMGPVTWGPVPVLFFKRTIPEEAADNDEESDVGLTLIGTGTSLPPSTPRVIAKRVILTGHPYHINKKIVTIRYMFFNREDVEWFKAMPLWTKRGRSGFVKEPLGTHGYFKATFDGRINPQDAIGVSLYKRVFPRNAEPVRGPLLETSTAASKADDGDMMME